MNIYLNPERAKWQELCRRPGLELEFLDSSVKNILSRIKTAGDFALRELTLQFDKVQLAHFHVAEEEITSAAGKLSYSLKDAIRSAAQNIEKFHSGQLRTESPVETMSGVLCWRKAKAIESIGIYIPGGSAPLFSTVLMLGIPARLAGCTDVVLCSPPDTSGSIHPAILYAAQLVGITRIFKAGGAQAVAALAYGTESIPAVSKIFGPGNQYVTKAKQIVSMEGTAIDMPAGPSEVLVVADGKSDPAFVAADLLSQAEHGTDSQVVLVTNQESVITTVSDALRVQLAALPRKDIATGALAHSLALCLANEDDIVAFINEYAPEHLILNTESCERLGERIVNAGSVFLGPWSPESAGDYASGTNHTLPTNGFAKAFGGVSVESFMKYITYQRISEAGLRKLGPIVETLASAENLEGHRASIRVRLNQLS